MLRNQEKILKGSVTACNTIQAIEKKKFHQEKQFKLKGIRSFIEKNTIFFQLKIDILFGH